MIHTQNLREERRDTDLKSNFMYFLKYKLSQFLHAYLHVLYRKEKNLR